MDINFYIEYMKQNHKGQKRKQGTPYDNHPLQVSYLLKDKGFPVEYQIVGLFHDLLEDTSATYEEIEKITNTKIAEAVKLLTKEKGYNMKDYIQRIKNNDIARMVKLADRIHNLSEAQFGSTAFQKKYIKETEEWFLDLAKDTIFETDLQQTLEDVKTHLKQKEKLANPYFPKKNANNH